MPLLLLVIGIASIIPAAWDAYRAHTIGWVGAIDNTQDRLDEIEQHDGLWSRKYPFSFSLSLDGDGELMRQVDDSDFYHVGIDYRVFVARPYHVEGQRVVPMLETMSIGYVKHLTERVSYSSLEVEDLDVPYDDGLMRWIVQVMKKQLRLSLAQSALGRSTRGLARGRTTLGLTVQHEGVMEPRPIHDEDGDPITNDAGELERTPVHAYSFYRVTDGTLGSPMSWERFWVQAWGVLRWTLVVPMGVYVFLFLMYVGSYFHRRKRRRLKQGLCIKCAYPMQPVRDGEGLICTECGYTDDGMNTATML
tara:strand:+ start:127282 stop:128199 length:918 start_codon:yes stop_codon:yes gene_type:complete